MNLLPIAQTASNANAPRPDLPQSGAGQDPFMHPPLNAAQLSSAERSAALDRLANLWRAGDLAAADPALSVRSTGFAALDAELPGGGWPTGQLIELHLASPGIGELGLLVPALAAVATEQRSTVWVLPYEHAPQPADRDALPYPPAMAAAGLDLARSLFVRPATPRESHWALEQALRANHLGAVIGWLPGSSAEGDFRALRRLHLLAARQRSLVFVLRDPQSARFPSPAAVRLELAEHQGGLNITLLKRRGRPLLDPVTVQVHPRHWALARLDPRAALHAQSHLVHH